MEKSLCVGVPGGGGYVGSVLVPRLLEEGYRVKVLDLFLYGREPLAAVADHPQLEILQGDVRDLAAVKALLKGCDAVIHLACISNDPSVELDPALSHSVNFESFGPFVTQAREAGVKRFLFASSGSVYGVSDSPDVTEEHPLVPVSLYNKYKAACEPLLQAQASADFVPVIVRPATICGYSPRQRLDLTVNILTSHAFFKRQITVFGGSQMRPNLHIQDMVDLYCLLLNAPSADVYNQIFNAAYQNHSVRETAEIIQAVFGQMLPEWGEIPIVTQPSDDIRSYHISSQKLGEVLNFFPRRTIQDGAADLIKAFQAGLLPDAPDAPCYHNLRQMKGLQFT